MNVSIVRCVIGSWVIKMAAEYAVYKGDKFIDLGTADYLAISLASHVKQSGIGRRRLIGRKTKVIRWLLYELKMINI